MKSMFRAGEAAGSQPEPPIKMHAVAGGRLSSLPFAVVLAGAGMGSHGSPHDLSPFTIHLSSGETRSIRALQTGTNLSYESLRASVVAFAQIAGTTPATVVEQLQSEFCDLPQRASGREGTISFGRPAASPVAFRGVESDQEPQDGAPERAAMTSFPELLELIEALRGHDGIRVLAARIEGSRLNFVAVVDAYDDAAQELAANAWVNFIRRHKDRITGSFSAEIDDAGVVDGLRDQGFEVLA